MAQGPQRQSTYKFQAFVLLGIILLSIALIAYYGFWRDGAGGDAGEESMTTADAATPAAD